MEDQLIEISENKITKKNIYGTFFLDDVEIALSVDYLQEVINPPEKIIPFPLAPSYLLGLITLRGEIIALVDLRERLKIKRESNFEDNLQTILKDKKIGIATYGEDLIGFIFDKTNEIIRPQQGEIKNFKKKPTDHDTLVAGCIQLSKDNRLIQVLDAERLVQIKNIPFTDNNVETYKKRKFRHKLKKEKAITFYSRNYHLGINIHEIEEIIKPLNIKPCPIEIDICKGLFLLRNNFIPLIDLEMLWLGNSQISNDNLFEEDHKIAIVNVNDVKIGLLISRLGHIALYDKEQVMRVPVLVESRSDLVVGCISDTEFNDFILINKNKLLSDEEWQALLSVAGSKKSEHTDEISIKAKDLGKRKTYISFRIDNLYGMLMSQIREVLSYKDQQIIQSPGSPFFVKGLMNLRGTIVTVVDSRKYYGFEEQNILEEEKKIIVFEKDNEFYGLIVDNIDSIITSFSSSNYELPHLVKQDIGKIKADISEVIEYKSESTNQTLIVILDTEPLVKHLKQEA